MHRRVFRVSALALSTLPLLTLGAAAQIAVSSNDNKIVNVDGVNNIVQNPPPDNATIIDLGVSPPKVIGQLDVPGSVVGPPQSVAISPDESIALVVASTKIDPTDPKKTTNDNKLSVIDLKASPPAVIATIEVGAAPAGVSFSPDGKLVLVANRGDGTVSILTVAGKTLTPAGKIALGDAKSGPEPRRLHPRRQEGARHARRRPSHFRAVGRWRQGRGHQGLHGCGHPPLQHLDQPQGRRCRAHQSGRRPGRHRHHQRHRPEEEPAAHRRFYLGRPDPRGCHHVSRRVLRGGDDPERLDTAEDASGLQRPRPGDGLSHRRARSSRLRPRPKSAAGPRAWCGARTARRCSPNPCWPRHWTF